MRVLVTGADGFIGKTLCLRLDETEGFTALRCTRGTAPAELLACVRQADAVVHLAGVNRPADPAEFMPGNVGPTRALADALVAAGRALPVIVASSTQAALDNPYGRSKRHVEEAMRAYGTRTGAPVHVLRLPNVFGKWARPHYNSAVATFCYQIARDRPIVVHDPGAPLRLLYIDDLVDGLLTLLIEGRVPALQPYDTSVGEVASVLRAFRASRETLTLPAVGNGLLRALYATYVSYLPPERFNYPLARHDDPRGVFVEVLKTSASGQFSFFTAAAGVTRGGHYHHSKTEKFLVLRGRARFRFRHMLDDTRHEVFTEGAQPQVVETVPGWAHDITNVGDEEMIVMLWANELFDRHRPDTVAAPC